MNAINAIMSSGHVNWKSSLIIRYILISEILKYEKCGLHTWFVHALYYIWDSAQL